MKKMLKTRIVRTKIIALILCLVVVTAFLPQGVSKAQSGTQLVVSPSTSNIPVGGSTTANLSVIAGSAVNGFDITITYDPAVVSLESWAHGSYLSNLLEVRREISSGRIRLVYVQNKTAEANGDGTLLTFTFRGVTLGSSAVSITAATLASSNGSTYSPPTQNGTINIVQDSTYTPTITPEATVTPTMTHTTTATSTHTPTATFTRTSTPTSTRTPTRTPTHAFVSSSTFTPTRSLSKTSTPAAISTGQVSPTLFVEDTATPVPTGTSAALLTLTVWPTTTDNPGIVKNLTATAAIVATTPTATKAGPIDTLIDLVAPEKLALLNQLMCGVSLLLLILLLILIIMIIKRLRSRNRNKSS